MSSQPDRLEATAKVHFKARFLRTDSPKMNGSRLVTFMVLRMMIVLVVTLSFPTMALVWQRLRFSTTHSPVKFVAYDLVGDSWVFMDEREGYLPGDRLSFGVTGLAMSGDGSRLVAASLATNGTDVAAVRTFDVINPEDDDYDPTYTPPEFEISGCVCNEVRVCIDRAVVPGSVIRLCLNTGTSTITFVGVDELALVEQDLSKFTYRAIHKGKSEFGTSVEMDGSAAFIETPFMDFFSGKFDVVATGVGLFQHSDTNRYVRGRILLDNAISSDFSIDVKVKEAEINQNPTSSAATQFGLLQSTVLFLFVLGLLVV